MKQSVVARHEAGHAVVNIKEGRVVKMATILRSRKTHRRVETEKLSRHARAILKAEAITPYVRDLVEKIIRGMLAGAFAQIKYAPRSWRRAHAEFDEIFAIEAVELLADS